jgi:hypothetical protein
MDEINATRAARGLEPFPILPDAYEPIEASEQAFDLARDPRLESPPRERHSRPNRKGLNMTQALEPCPFCGGEAVANIIPESVGGVPGDGDWEAGCRNRACLVQPMATDFVDEASAVAAWNKRAISG